MNWDDIRFFSAVVEHENISHAGKALGVSPQTVARKITALEHKLATTLFIRHPRGYRPNADAMSLIDEVKHAEQLLNTLQNKFMNKSQRFMGTVRIAAPEMIAIEVLLPALKPFLERYPELNIELITGISTIGIAKGDADIALRLVRPEQGALTIKKVATMSSGLYAHLDHDFNSEHSRLIGWDTTIDLPAVHWLKNITGREANIRLNSLAAQRAAIAAGLGVGILPCFLAEGLVRLPQQIVMKETIWLLTHASNVSTPRIRLVYDEISMIMKKYSAKFDPIVQ
ncbi:LysR family transcriptional regulator [Acinetobacter rudis]|uniref:LysR family transcriptional regulator n=1 Tax=Acinetobacter rudis TaxID=632955 RepID=UPI00280D86FE|nr:LysR family transcriptional regulator [Acinetobacter rudis]MDQ8952148.1 LysR family transcriptional regulator [Acinetobacter rudis]